MAYREKPFCLLRRHPLVCRVFMTELYLLHLGDRAAIVYPHHFLLWTDNSTIEVGRTNNKFDLHCLPKFFQDFPTRGLRETLTLFDASRHALPLPCGKVLLLRALQEKVPPVRLAPYERADHCTKTTDSHGRTTPVEKKLPNAGRQMRLKAGVQQALAGVGCTPC